MKEITFQDAQEIVNKINDKQGTRKTFAEMYGISENTLSRRLKDHGYAYNQSTKKYDLASPENTSSKPESKQPKRPKEQKIIKEEIQKVRMLKKVTYEIDEDTHFELRMKAFREKRNVSELVEQAIRQYLRDE